jgi:hypothetical protein
MLGGAFLLVYLVSVCTLSAAYGCVSQVPSKDTKHGRSTLSFIWHRRQVEALSGRVRALEASLQMNAQVQQQQQQQAMPGVGAAAVPITPLVACTCASMAVSIQDFSLLYTIEGEVLWDLTACLADVLLAHAHAGLSCSAALWRPAVGADQLCG